MIAEVVGVAAAALHPQAAVRHSECPVALDFALACSARTPTTAGAAVLERCLDCDHVAGFDLRAGKKPGNWLRKLRDCVVPRAETPVWVAQWRAADAAESAATNCWAVSVGVSGQQKKEMAALECLPLWELGSHADVRRQSFETGPAAVEAGALSE